MNNINNYINSSLPVKLEPPTNNQNDVNTPKEDPLLIGDTNITERQVNNDFAGNANNQDNILHVANIEETNNSFEQTALLIDSSDLSDLSFISEEEIKALDLSEYHIISNAEINDSSVPTYFNFDEYQFNTLISECINKTYNLLANNFISTKLNEFMLTSYNYIFKSSDTLRGLNEINILLDNFKNKETINQELVIELCRLNKDNFYQILISQIHAKLFVINAENNFIKILYDLYIYIKNSTANMTCTKHIKTLKKLMLYSLNTMIKETATHIINEKNVTKLANGITGYQLKYEYTEISNEDIEDQFIKDAIRKPHISFSLLKDNQELWNTNSEDIQQLNLQSEHITDHIEKMNNGKKIFKLCYNEISKFLSDFNSDDKDQLIKAILLELTQAGAAPASLTMLSMQDNLNKILCLPANYLCKSTSGYKRTNLVKIEDNQVVIETSITFFSGIFIKSSSDDFIIDNQPINITTSLLLNNNELALSKYDNVQIKYGSVPSA